MAYNDPIEPDHELNAQCDKEARKHWNRLSSTERIIYLLNDCKYHDEIEKILDKLKVSELLDFCKVKFKKLPKNLQSELESFWWDTHYN